MLALVPPILATVTPETIGGVESSVVKVESSLTPILPEPSFDFTR